MNRFARAEGILNGALENMASKGQGFAPKAGS
jgi:hypothetical protein